jgi:hypothetical protein
MGMGRHQSPTMKSDTWLTPPHIVRALGEFDLDPCCPPKMPWQTAKKTYTKADDGLKQPWAGRVWLNPPYSREAVKWLEKMAAHGDGISLTFARTETRWFVDYIWHAAHAVLFLHGRLNFHDADGNPGVANGGAPSCLAAYGAENARILETCGLRGTLWRSDCVGLFE